MTWKTAFILASDNGGGGGGSSDVIDITEYTVIPNAYVQGNTLRTGNDQDTYAFDLGSDGPVIFSFLCHYGETIPDRRRFSLLFTKTSPEDYLNGSPLVDASSILDDSVAYGTTRGIAMDNRYYGSRTDSYRYLYFTPTYNGHSIDFPFKLWTRPFSDVDY